MIPLFLHFIALHFSLKVPAVFFYASTRMMLAALTAGCFTIFFGPRFIQKLYALKMGQSIRVADCPGLAQLHEKKKDTPTMGGILILSSMLTSLILWMDLSSVFTVILAITTIWLGLIGGTDDYLKLKHKNSKGLSARRKMIFQTLFAVFLSLYLYCPMVTKTVAFEDLFVSPTAKEHVIEDAQDVMQQRSLQQYSGQYYFPFLKDPLFVLSGTGLFVAFVITWFTVTGASNAVNLTDGLDGLAAGCLVMVSVVLGIFGFFSNNIEMARYLNILYIEGSGEIAVYLFAMAGACLGFLWYNGYPAQVIMGDTGSLALGGILGVSAVLMRRELLLALIGGIFVIETLSVILQVGSYKLRNRKRIFLCTPIHHHFEYKGWPETKVVIRFWIVGFLFVMIGLASLKFQ
ncbi:MAG: phospho-N-acetylmuramoyl-pentapeptide-transferase [Simkania sp.]|nr:phospho-N-acetylmuramoyl-pentapeptide-transferase [Simkania sp.]